VAAELGAAFAAKVHARRIVKSTLWTLHLGLPGSF